MPNWIQGVYYWLTSDLFTKLGFLLALVFLANLLRQKRSPSSTMAWLLVILLEPYVGVPLYVMFGGRKMNPLARRKARIYSRSPAAPEGSSGVGTERLLASYGVPPAREGNCFELVTDGIIAYERLLRLIEEAKSTIHITTYILGSDEGSREILERLKRRAAEGISVRLLIDDLGILAVSSARFDAPDRSWRTGCLLHAGIALPVEGTCQPQEPSEADLDRRPYRPHRRHEPRLALYGTPGFDRPLAQHRGRRRGTLRRRHGGRLRVGLGIRDRFACGIDARSGKRHKAPRPGPRIPCRWWRAAPTSAAIRSTNRSWP